MSTTPATRLPRVRASEFAGRGWLNTGGREVTLADLRGKIVILDFWTFCCINCLHVLDELRELEAAHRDELVIVGVHSPKFEHEADPDALAAAVERYEVHHAVLDDPELVTWGAYAARAWPTLVVVDPEGYVVAQMAGEGHASAIGALVAELIEEHGAKGTLHRGDGPYVPPAPASGTLRFPAKAIALPSGNLLVADAGHHSLAELAGDGETLVRRIGSGDRGLADGGPGEARFSEPGGLCLVPEATRATLGYDVVVADTVNHALRGVRLSDGGVVTLAGTGRQFMVGGQENVAGRTGAFDAAALHDARSVNLSSPWDVVWSAELGAFVVAMAGNHTLWSFRPARGRETVRLLAGTMNEGLEDGPGADAWFAQPSGLAPAADGALWLADAETSALRRVVPADAGDPARVGAAAVGTNPLPPGVEVETAVGQGLFDFGHRDGAGGRALLQHPLGVAVLPDGSVVVADTYNGALRRYVPPAETIPGAGGPLSGGEVSTLATGLAEPSDVVVQVNGRAWAPGDPVPDGGEIHLLVVESAAHRLTRIAVREDLAGEVLDSGARRTQRPATDIAAGPLRLEVPFEPAPGQKLDDRWGPSTELRVSATPPELLRSGAGSGTDLFRDLEIDPAVAEGVLHVTAKAASCDVVPVGPDGEPDPEAYPACHLASQDWGVPVRVVPADGGGQGALTLPLRG
ncbi:NHL domain-containing thioredoxin family protein [Myceligenerans pegani]|uniref:Redoxin domain-containing protein n=1 Tax=Myceligenerans pegani TaxID=2776917 RepID=A0ABR9MS04_9MICO|nr:NHL domain-containing thioredoxin family protein [Myceligenerans sp. TRM 65318]MBE1874160.1 redoxin domain-containing protein [Myceligenerans sp. TRM 65318]MBE3016432.1 redoxin domain-containing protein [Myceligenerans sp. TRM 65318]